MKKGAFFDPNRKFRWVLWRIWSEGVNTKRVLFIGLNPSTADEKKDDPTITRCINYAKAWGYGGIYMCNLFALRATDPEDMMKDFHPVGKQNDINIGVYADLCDMIVFCWGVNGDYLERDKVIIKRFPDAHCLAVSKHGHPKHPLYLKKDLLPIPFMVGNPRNLIR